MDTFTHGTAMELAKFGVSVNGVRPGLIYTDMHSLSAVLRFSKSELGLSVLEVRFGSAADRQSF